jgi:hypothetical protein
MISPRTMKFDPGSCAGRPQRPAGAQNAAGLPQPQGPKISICPLSGRRIGRRRRPAQTADRRFGRSSGQSPQHFIRGFFKLDDVSGLR